MKKLFLIVFALVAVSVNAQSSYECSLNKMETNKMTKLNLNTWNVSSENLGVSEKWYGEKVVFKSGRIIFPDNFVWTTWSHYNNEGNSKLILKIERTETLVAFHLSAGIDVVLFKENGRFHKIAVSYRYDEGATRYAYSAMWEIDMPLFNLAKAFPNTPINR